MDYNYEKETLQAFREGRLIPEKDGKCTGCPYQCPRKKCLKEE